MLCVLFGTETAYLSRVLGTSCTDFPLQDVHPLCQPPHRPSQYKYTGGYASLEEIKLQEGVKDFCTSLPCYLSFHVEFYGGLEFLSFGLSSNLFRSVSSRQARAESISICAEPFSLIVDVA